MKYILDDYHNFEFPPDITGDFLTVEIGNQSICFRKGANALIARPGLSFGTKNYQFEKARRIEATLEAQRKLGKLVPQTTFFEMKSKKGKSNTPKLLMVRMVPWVDNIVYAQKLPIKTVLHNKLLCKSIVRVSLFTISQFIVTGRAFDFFCVFGEYKDHQGRNSISNLLIPRNIMIGRLLNGEEIIFVDPDWFVRVSDTNLSGYAAKSYRKRIFQGMLLLVCSIVFATSGVLFFSHFNKAK